MSYDLSGFVLWERPQRYRRGELRVSVSAKHIGLSVVAFKALGQPKRVALMVDQKGRRLAFRAAREDDPVTWAVHPKSHQIGGSRIIRLFELAPGYRPVVVQQGMVVFRMDLAVSP